MNHKEEQMLRQLKNLEGIGIEFLNKIQVYYQDKSEILDTKSLKLLRPTTLRLEFLGKKYLLNVEAYDNKHQPQIAVYIPREGTFFFEEPEFILKQDSKIHYDRHSNLFTGQEGAVLDYIDYAAWEILKEMAK